MLERIGTPDADRVCVPAVPRRKLKSVGAEIGGGQRLSENQAGPAPSDTKPIRRKAKRRGAMGNVHTDQVMPPAAPIPEIGGGHLRREDQGACALSELTSIVNHLVGLQKQRKFCITSQSRCDRSLESFLASLIGFTTEQDEKDRKAIYKRVSQFRREVEKNGPGHSYVEGRPTTARSSEVGVGGHSSCEDQLMSALTPYTEIVLLSAQARSCWDAQRIKVEAEMEELARKLPAYEFMQSVRGFAAKGLAIIIGETGDLAGYATKEKVWKRLGLAVINGERQRKMPGADAKLQGYSPVRRSQIWTLLSDSLFRAQWRGDRDEDGKKPKDTKKPIAVPAHPIGPYGEIYYKRKLYVQAFNDVGAYEEKVAGIVAGLRKRGKTVPAENLAGRMTQSHIHNDATRVMSKALIENLWRVWNGKRPLTAAENATPRANLAA